MDKASLVLSEGANFLLLGPEDTMIPSRVPVISVCAVRTGCGKSVITRKIADLLKERGIQVSVIRHPMAYCGFQPVLRFSGMEEVEKETCTIEEREEFEPLVEMGITVYAGIDYEQVLREAERESQVILWDGGNNDFPFIRPDWEIVLLDALRPGHERLYYPGEVNLRRADLLIITKVNEAQRGVVKKDQEEHFSHESGGKGFGGSLRHPTWIIRNGFRTKGSWSLRMDRRSPMEACPLGQGQSASKGLARELVDPRPYAVGSLKRGLSEVPSYRKCPSRDGLFRRTDEGSGRDHPACPLRCRGHCHAGRSSKKVEDRSACSESLL